MTWKPTDHLHYALGLVEQIETDAQACGIALLPTLKWRMAQVISEALATAENNGRVASEIDVLAAKYRDQNMDGLPHVTITNGKASVEDYGHSTPVGLRDLEERYSGTGTTTAQSAVDAGYGHTTTVALSEASVTEALEAGMQVRELPPPLGMKSEKPAKRGRGRPKGAKGKKKKAKKPLAMPQHPPSNPEASS